MTHNLGEISYYIIDKMMRFENSNWKDDSINYLDTNILTKLENAIIEMGKEIPLETLKIQPSPLFKDSYINYKMSLIDGISIGCETELNHSLQHIKSWNNLNNCLKEIINHFN